MDKIKLIKETKAQLKEISLIKRLYGEDRNIRDAIWYLEKCLKEKLSKLMEKDDEIL